MDGQNAAIRGFGDAGGFGDIPDVPYLGRAGGAGFGDADGFGDAGGFDYGEPVRVSLRPALVRARSARRLVAAL